MLARCLPELLTPGCGFFCLCRGKFRNAGLTQFYRVWQIHSVTKITGEGGAGSGMGCSAEGGEAFGGLKS